MKHKEMKYTTALCLALTLALAACNDDSAIGEMTTGRGALELRDISVQQAAGVEVAGATRAVEADLEVEIQQVGSTDVKHFAAGAAELSGRIELPAGEYTLRAYTSNHDAQYTGTQLGEPKYYGETQFSIEEETVTYCSLLVPMTNAGIKLTLPEGFGTWFSNYTFTVTLGARTIALDNGATAYFDVAGTTAEAQCVLTATNIDSEHMSGTTRFAVEPGQVYNVTYSMATRTLSVTE